MMRALIEAMEDRVMLTAAPNVWQSVPIQGGGYVSGIVTSPAQQNLIYARTDVGGAYRWIAATSSWLPLTDFVGRADGQLTGVLSIAADPSNANKVYIAAGQYTASWAQTAAIFASSDQGATWSRSNLSIKLGGNEDGRDTGERLQVDPNLGSTLFLGTNNNGLWKSTNSAGTWTQVAAFPASSITFVLMDKSSATTGNATQVIYVGVNTTTGTDLYRSADGGSTWAAIANEPTGMIADRAVLSSAGILYVTYNNALGPNNITAGAVWSYKSATSTWTNITPPTGQGGFAGISVDAQHPATLMVTTLDRWFPKDEIYRSTNGGASWNALDAKAVFNTSTAPVSVATPHWMSDIEIDPFNSNHVMFNTGYGIWSSSDITSADSSSATHWSFTDSGLEETVVSGLIAPPTGAPLLSTVGDVDGFVHTSLTSVPSSKFSPSIGSESGLDFAAALPSKIVRIGNGGAHGFYSTNGGTTWTAFAASPPPLSTEGAGHIAISANGSTLVWQPSNSGAYYSTNNGSTWTASTGAPNTGANSFWPVADRVNSTKFYIYDSTAGKVFVSTDSGVTFIAAATGLPTGGPGLAVAPGIEGELWQAANSGGLYHSSNSGTSFSKLASVQEAYTVGFGKAAPGKTYPAVYMWGKVGGVVGVYRSDDTGATWVQINDANHQFGWIDVLTGDPNTYGRVYLGTGGRGIVYGDLPVTLSGTIFNDVNGNGVLDGSESGISGTTVFIDANNNGVLDSGETSTTTSASGAYFFSNLAPGSYTVRQMVPAGYVQTGPGPGASPPAAITSSIAPNGSVSSANFGNFPISFSGASGNHTYFVRLNAAQTNLEIDQSATALAQPTFTVAKALVPSLTFAFGGGIDSLVVDFSNGNPISAGGLSFNGGGGGDSLTMNGGSSSSTVQVGGTTVTFGSAVITYAATSSLTINTGAGNDVLTQTAEPGAALSFNGGTGSDILNVNAGTFTFAADPQSTTANLTINDNSAVTFNAGSVGGGIYPLHVSALNLGAAATAALFTPPAHSDRSILITSGLSISASASLDLGGNDLLIHSNIFATVAGYIATGFNAGAWNGKGISSSAAAGDPTHLTALGALKNDDGAGNLIYGATATYGLFDGQNPALGDVMVKYTYLGDADLSGKVDGTDYAKIDNGFNTHLITWFNGDFNFDNVIDGSDYSLIDNAFNTQGVALSDAGAAQIAQPAAMIAASNTKPAALRNAGIIPGLLPLSSSDGSEHTGADSRRLHVSWRSLIHSVFSAGDVNP